MTRIAAPDYVGRHALDACPPGHRFWLYLQPWNHDWKIGEGGKTAALAAACKLGDGADLLAALRARQLDLACALPPERRFIVDAVATAPFATGLGNEHPIENGFAFLTPYGLPYLAGSGFKGVLRRAAQMLLEDRTAGLTADAIDALFGPEDGGADGSGEPLAEAKRRRGALTCWDVLPAPPNGELAVEIMTPHHGAYYQDGQSPHDAEQPNPIPFLALPVGSKLRFVASFEPALWPGGLAGIDWRALVGASLRHAFDWAGFGSKTAVGYGAMSVDEAEREARERDEAARREASKAVEDERRRATMSPEQIEAEQADERIKAFRAMFEAEKTKGYRAGSPFDEERAKFLKHALALSNPDARRACAAALRESYKVTGFPAKAQRKLEVRQSLTTLDGQP